MATRLYAISGADRAIVLCDYCAAHLHASLCFEWSEDVDGDCWLCDRIEKIVQRRKATLSQLPLLAVEFVEVEG